MRRRAIMALAIASLAVPLSAAKCDEAAETLVLATYKLQNESSTATGLAVRFETSNGQIRRVLVTANHVLQQMSGDHCVLVSRIRHNDDTFVRQEITIPIRDAGRPVWKKHGKHDLGVLPLPAAIEIETVPFDSLVTDEQLAKVHTGDAVRLAVFPERSEANRAGFPVLRGGFVASYPVVPAALHPAFLVDTTAWTGDSGGPVMHANLPSPSGGPLVIGVVRGMRNITDTVKESRFVERRTHYPLGISEVLHARFVRDVILELR